MWHRQKMHWGKVVVHNKPQLCTFVKSIVQITIQSTKLKSGILPIAVEIGLQKHPVCELQMCHW